MFSNAVPFGLVTVVNLTPHPVVFRDANGTDHTFPGPGKGGEARVDQPAPVINPARTSASGLPIAFPHADGDLVGLPAPVPGVVFVVSMLVRQHPSVVGRADVVSPGTGPQDGTVRNDKGHVVAVTVFIGA